MKICAVPNCNSGCSNDRVDRRKLGLRQLTLFTLPKCVKKLRVWENALGCTLAKDGAICQLHFLNRDIKKTDKTVLKNGMVHEIPRARWGLSSDAVPVAPGHPELNPQIDLQLAAPEEVEIDLHLAAPEEAQINHTGVSIANDVVMEQLCDTEIKTFENPEIEETKSDFATVQKPNEDIFTIHHLKDELSSMILPEAWAWTKTMKSLKFTLYDCRAHVPKIHLELNDDLSMTLITISGRRILLDPVTSMENMCATFRSVETIQICDGTGMENKRRAPDCFGILDEFEEYARRRLTLRCDSCRNLRRNLQRNVNRSIPITEVRKVGRRRKILSVEKKRIHLTREAI